MEPCSGVSYAMVTDYGILLLMIYIYIIKTLHYLKDAKL